MKKLLLLPALGLALSSCISLPGLFVSNLDFRSNYRLTSGPSVVCDNLVTALTYTFRYSGDLASWTSVLVGQTTGATSGELTVTPGIDPDVTYANGVVKVTYELAPNTAPLKAQAAAQRVSPQAIIVEPVPQPPTTFSNEIGRVDLRLTVRNTQGDSGTLRFGNIRVGDCR